MTIDDPVIPVTTWLGPALAGWAIQVLTLLAVGLALGLVLAIVRQGPAAGFWSLVRFAAAAFMDLVRMSPRRVFALARLAVVESLRRMVLAGFVVFMVILLFAGWYLDPGGANPARLYISFVLSATSLMSALLAVFLSVFSLPADLRNKTIYTVVTKPVRPSEIVLGRILGFAAIGTAMLALVGVASYFFVTRGLNHTHEVLENTLAPETDRDGTTGATVGRTSLVHNHRHTVRIDAQGRGTTSYEQGHVHQVFREESGGRVRYRLGPPEGLLQARVPRFGRLQIYDRQGQPGSIDVGKEKKRQGWIEGGTQAAAVWTFDNIREAEFPDGLPLELNLGVFRTAMGDVSQGVLGNIVLRSATDPAKQSAPRSFVSQEYKSDLQFIPRALQSPEGQPLDLYKDLAPDGKLQIIVTCLQNEQYLGMAPADLYVRAPDASFAANFVKGYVAIWLQMIVITCVGVTLSTFLNAAVALLGTMAVIIGGFVKSYIVDVALDRVIGGGPIEALVRTVMQINQVVPLEPGLGTTLIKRFDEAYRAVLRVIAGAVPDLSSMSGSTMLAQGYDLPVPTLVEQGLTALAYIIPVYVVGFVFFKLREVAR